MLIASIFREASQALRFNRQRSILTMISLAWGVACFVILYSYGEGFHFALQKAFRSVGQDLVLMYRGQTSAQAGGERAGRRIRLERTDVDAIRDSVPLVAAVSPEMMLHGVNVVHGYRNQTMTLRGVEPVYSRIRNQSVAAGRWIESEDDAQKRRVAVLGSEAATKLFGEVPPVGEQISINGLRFEVVGLLQTKTQIANYETPDNESIFIPYEAASLYADLRYPTFIVWMPANPVFREETVRQVRQTLARQHNFSPTDERAVGVVIFNQYMRLIDTMGIALRLLLGFVGSLTLAIGGVGLANIMLVSVTERTREIGILKSLGASRGSILIQFLLEAMAIVTIGGVCGVLAGWSLTSVLGTLPLLGPLFKDTSGQGDIHLHLSAFSVIASTIMLETVGLISGLLPAVKASRLDPILALHYE
ncbi:MAG TPA: ABC transporter permease [Bryobacteraceae bacterium]|nr:ABC transporter permease [Bryobacteraceae bacterium]